MEFVLYTFVHGLGGAIGANISAHKMREHTLGVVGNSLAGLIGGVVFGSFLSPIIGLVVPAIGVGFAAGLLGGAMVTPLVGLLKTVNRS